MKVVFQELFPNMESSFIVTAHDQPSFTDPFHFHHGFEITFVVESYGKVYAGNRIMNFKAGELYLFGPGFAHCFYNEKSFVASKKNARAITVKFKEDFLGSNFFHSRELRKVKQLLDLSYSGIRLTAPDQIVPLFFQLVRQNGMDALLLLLQILNMLSLEKSEALSVIGHGAYKLPYNSNDAAKMETVLKYVFDNFSENVTSQQAAHLANMKEAAFSRYFKRRVKKTFSQFVNDVRVTHATKLLVEMDWEIQTICKKCGFENVSYFNRQFKAVMGKTPRQYRKGFLQS